MAKRKIEVMSDPELKDGGYCLSLGDVVSVDDELAAYWIGNGWAKCSESGEMGDRVPGSQFIQPNSK